MDRLRNIIHTLTKEEQKAFEAFAKRLQHRPQRKDIALFRLLAKDVRWKAPQLTAKLYEGDDTQLMAYHALRKRLMRDLTDFIVMQRHEHDTTAALGWLSLSRYLFDRGNTADAWHYLSKAEKTAQANEHFDVLMPIYSLQIERWQANHEAPLEALVEKWQHNKRLADEDERASVVYSIIQQKLRKIQQEGQDLTFNQTIAQLLEQYQLTEAVSQRPKLRYHLLSIARSAVLVRKDYHAFAPYLLSQYQQMLAQGFSPAHRYYQLGLLYMIAHVFYRSKQFKKASGHLEDLHQLLQKDTTHYYEDFYPKYVLLHAANHSFLGNNQQAIQMLTTLLEQAKGLPTEIYCNAYLNLGFYYFQQGKHREAAQALRVLNRSDQWYEQHLGKEWALKKGISELMFHYDRDQLDLAFNKMERLEKHYRGLFQHPAYQNAYRFLQLIKQFFKNPQAVGNASFMEQVDQSLTFLPTEEEDLQAMSFYAWLKSKMVKRPYYEVLLELAWA